MTFTLQIECDGAFFEAPPGMLTVGFTERGAYRISAVEGHALYVDDVRLEEISAQNGRVWCWSPGYYAGEVVAELLNDVDESIATYRLDVSADESKLGSVSYAEMVSTILNFDPSLLFGTEDAQRGIGNEGNFTNPHLQYARLRRYGEPLLGALQQVTQKPLASLRRARATVGGHQVKRLDVLGVRKALMSSTGLALLHEACVIKPRLSAVKFDVSSAYEERDNPANQTLGLILAELIRRCRQVRGFLQEIGARESRSETRSPLHPRLVRRIAFVETLISKLERIQRASPFRELTQRSLSAAGLNAISAHPNYARAYRFGWYALRSGVLGQDNDETLWLSPTWEIYERWCFVTVVAELKKLYPNLMWKRRSSSVKTGRILWRGAEEGTVLDVWFQVRCPAIDRKPYHGFSSLSGLRLPDIVITLKSATIQRFIVLDAKYRSSRFGVLDAMASAHLYHDSLRWHGRKPDACYLLIPRGGAVAALESSAYRSLHGIGALVLGTGSDGNVVRAELKQVLSCEL